MIECHVIVQMHFASRRSQKPLQKDSVRFGTSRFHIRSEELCCYSYCMSMKWSNQDHHRARPTEKVELNPTEGIFEKRVKKFPKFVVPSELTKYKKASAHQHHRISQSKTINIMETISSSSALLVLKSSQRQTQDYCNEKQPFTNRVSRRHSELTASTTHTCSTATFSEDSSEFRDDSSAPCTELLIAAITQKLMKSMMCAASSAHSVASSKQSDSECTGFDNELEDVTKTIRELAERVMSDKNGSFESNQDLRNLVLKKLAIGSQTSGGANTGNALDNSQCTSSNSSVVSTSPSQSEATRSTSGSNTGNGLQEYLASLTAVTSDSDDSSVLSDLSGLTGVFSEHSNNKVAKADNGPCPRVAAANEARTKQKTHPAAAAVAVAVAREGAISFGSVDVRYYERIASDNPSSTSGPSIGIGWNFKGRGQLTVDEWEKERASQRRKVFQLSAEKRTKLLIAAGCTNKEIVDMIRIVNKSRSQRKSTIDNLHTQTVEEVVEQTTRSLGRLFFGRKQALVEC